MSLGYKENCDLFIRRCHDAIALRDIHEARNILIEATSVFEAIIPDWKGGLMSQFTGFYFDDARMILGKLNTFKANSYQALPRDYFEPRHPINVIETDEMFDAAILEIQKSATDKNWKVEQIVAQLQEIQEICKSKTDFSERWLVLKPYIQWVATLEAELAQFVMPLIKRSLR